MRDLFVTLAVFGSIPLIFRKPFFGVLVSVWLGLMNPHRLCWGFAVNMPFALITAVTLILAFVISKEPKRLPATSLTWLLAFWWFWLFVSTVTAFYPDWAWDGWNRAWRIMLLAFLTLALLNTRERIDALVWVCVVSLGVYGVKGGIFTLLGGGVSHVWGPDGSFIAGNNEIGLALVMTIPLMRYLHLQSRSKWVKIGLVVAMLLSLASILGTQSRGDLLGLLVMAFYLALKSRNRASLVLLLGLAMPAGYMFMPDEWHERMASMQNYQQDASAMGRINAWWTAWYVALDHPFVGGGFQTFLRPTFLQYAPEPLRVHDVHSIYFQALGEHGFVGLFVFLAILLGTLVTLSRVAKVARGNEDLKWMRDLASMVFVSIIGFAVAGAFLGLAMFDYFYTLVAITIGLKTLSNRYQKDGIPKTMSADVVSPGPARPAGPGGRVAISQPPLGRRILGALTQWYARL